MADYVTRDELDKRDERLRAEMAEGRAKTAREVGALEERMTRVEGRVDGTHDLFLKLFERLDQMDDKREQQTQALMTKIDDAMVTVAQVRQYQRIAGTLLDLALHLPFLRWLKVGLGWLFAIAGGVALAVAVMMILTH